MKRKIIAQGNNSYTITLPVNWIREESLKGGDEVEIIESNEGIMITTKQSLKKEKTSIDINGYTDTQIRIALTQNYLSGYDEITLLNAAAKKKIIEKIITERLFGFEIVDQTETSLIIKSISEPFIENFKHILKKVFFMLKEQFVSNSDELTNNKLNGYINFCRRLILIHNIGGKKLSSQFSLFLSRLLLMQHDLARANSNHEFKKEIKKRFDELYSIFYKQDFYQLKNTYALASKNLYEDLPILLKKSKSKETLELYYLGNALRNLYLALANTHSFFMLDRTFI